MLCESKLRACSPFALYLSSFEIMLNVMLDLRWELAAFLNFTQRCASQKQRKLKHQSERQEFFQSSCWLLLELLQERVDECAGNGPFKLALFYVALGFESFPQCCHTTLDSREQGMTYVR